MEIDIEILSHDAARIQRDIIQLHEGSVTALRRAKSYQGGMRWKKASSNGMDYLFRGADRKGNGKSLGKRSPETEKIHSEFTTGRVKARSALKVINARLDEYARLAKAARINRLPDELALVLRALEMAELGNRAEIVGTNCLYAFEAAAGVRVLSAALSTQDVDILFDSRVSADMIVDDLESILAAIKSADDNYEVSSKQPYRLMNGTYMIDIIIPFIPISRKTISVHGLSPAEIEGLEWLVNSPKMDQVVVAHDGHSAAMRVPVPEAFAAHKLWLSKQIRRPADQRRRDLLQARTVTKIILDHLAGKISMKILRAFPRNIAEDYLKFVARI